LHTIARAIEPVVPRAPEAGRAAMQAYAPQAQFSHSQTSHVHVSPSQSGHWQALVAAPLAEQQEPCWQVPVCDACAAELLSPLEHLQSSHVQISPSMQLQDGVV
jgi:hypothetical protein